MDPQHTALVLIGYQNDYFAPDGVLSRVIEEASRVTGTLTNTVDVLERLSAAPVLIVSTPLGFTPDYSELTEPVGILKTVKEMGAFKAGTPGAETIPELRRMKDHFAKFVPETVKRLLAANPETPGLGHKHARDISVLFVDISGYSHLSEQLPPETLNALVERYFSVFLDRIHEAGGDMNETGGDGFMTVFQEMDRHLHAHKAVDTALALLAATEKLNQENSEHPLAIHMGLNSGTTLVGATRFEGLHGVRWTFTASGPVTNLAARLAGRAKAGQILIGPETRQRLGDHYRLERLGPQRLKNIAEAIEIYRVLSRNT